MAKGKRGGSRRAAFRPRVSSAGNEEDKKNTRSGGAHLSDSSEEFLPLSGQDKYEDSSEEENALLERAGFKGAEHEMSDEDQESDDDAESNSEESASDENEADNASADSGEEESRTAWGRRAKDFYGESSSDESSEDEEEMRERMEEAVRVAEVEDVEGMKEADFGTDARSIEALQQLLALQHKTLDLKDRQALQQLQGKEGTEHDLLWKANLDAEVGAILDGFSGTGEHMQQQQKPQSAAAGLSEEELKQIVATAHPELHGLLKELQDALKEINGKVEPLIALAKRKKLLTREGVSLLDAKNQLLLSYLSYLSYYIVLKAHGVPVASHPVVERLIESRLLLQKLRPIEAALKPQLERLLTDGGDSATPRARPETFAAVGESDDEEQQGEQLSDEASIEDGDSWAEEEDAKSGEAYKPPKMVSMEYTTDKVSAQTRASRELQRAAERLKKSELVRAVREMTSDAPEEIGIERFMAAQAHRAAAREAGFLHAGNAEEEEEQFELMRRSLSKKERKAQAAQRALFEKRAAAAVGSTLEDLTAFYEQPLGGGEDGEDELGLSSKKAQSRGVLGHYLNAAKQAAEEAAKMHKAQAERLIIAREQNLQHLSRHSKDIRKQDSSKPAREGSDDEEFAALAGAAKERTLEKKKRLKEKAEAFLPQEEEEVEGQRRITREIKANRGLVRKRRKFEGNARVHNRMKYEQKAKKLKSLRPEMRPVEDRSYLGEAAGLRPNLKRSRTLH
ncbi:Neuroguidin, related [Eimeria praecox]|uniref:Neuroguidin, related n=1 Tax=Eimeria praecox TaxID=51316 RepID=U6GBK6_9EIME|nr:Neuroguidin, related [Eimeria praecox]